MASPSPHSRFSYLTQIIGPRRMTCNGPFYQHDCARGPNKTHRRAKLGITSGGKHAPATNGKKSSRRYNRLSRSVDLNLGQMDEADRKYRTYHGRLCAETWTLPWIGPSGAASSGSATDRSGPHHHIYMWSTNRLGSIQIMPRQSADARLLRSRAPDHVS